MDLIDKLRSLNAEVGNIIPKNMLFNEGWLLRVLLKREQEKNTNMSIYSEAQLRCPTANESIKKIGSTRVDGIVGDFDPRQLSGVRFRHDLKCLDVYEAKIRSPLSRRTKNIDDINQVTRIAISIICELLKADIHDISQKAVSIIVLYPRTNAKKGNLGAITREQIRAQVQKMIEYGAINEEAFIAHWEILFRRIKLKYMTWGYLLKKKYNQDSPEYEFYKEVLRANKAKGSKRKKKYYNKCI